MKQTFKKPSYYLLSQAMDGDEKAIEKILAFYDPYISKCCLRPLYDEYGKQTASSWERKLDKGWKYTWTDYRPSTVGLGTKTADEKA